MITWKTKRSKQSKALQTSKCRKNNTDRSYILDNDNFTSLLDSKDKKYVWAKNQEKETFESIKYENDAKLYWWAFNNFQFIASENGNVSIDNKMSLNQVFGYLL